MGYAEDGPSDLVAEALAFWQILEPRHQGAETCAQYAAECGRAVNEGHAALPDGSAVHVYKRRAAFLWAASRVLERWIDGADVSDRELRGAIKLLRRYPPGESDIPPTGGAARPRKRRRISGTRTKDRVAARLETERPGWQDCFFAAAKNARNNVDAIAVTLAIPIRPVELEFGVRIDQDGGRLRIHGVGGKVNGAREQGQPSWTIWLDPSQGLPEVSHLARRVANGPLTVQCPRHTLRRAIARAAYAALGAGGTDVSPYVLRHAQEAALHGRDPVFVAHVSKHASTRSQISYGRLTRGRRVPAVVEAEGSRPVRVPCQHPAHAQSHDGTDFVADPGPAGPRL